MEVMEIVVVGLRIFFARSFSFVISARNIPITLRFWETLAGEGDISWGGRHQLGGGGGHQLGEGGGHQLGGGGGGGGGETSAGGGGGGSGKLMHSGKLMKEALEQCRPAGCGVRPKAYCSSVVGEYFNNDVSVNCGLS